MKTYRARIGNAHVAVESWSVLAPRKPAGSVLATLRGRASDASTKRLGAMSSLKATSAVVFAGADIVVRGRACFSMDASKTFEDLRPIHDGWDVTLDLWFPKRPTMVRP